MPGPILFQLQRREAANRLRGVGPFVAKLPAEVPRLEYPQFAVLWPTGSVVAAATVTRIVQGWQRFPDLKGAVQVIETYRYLPPETRVKPGWSQPKPLEVAPALAWSAVAFTALPPTSKAAIFRTDQPIQFFAPRPWSAIATTALPPASFSVVVRLALPIDAFAPRAWQSGAATVLPPTSSAVARLGQPIETFAPRSWQAVTVTFLPPGSTAAARLARPPIDTFYPQAWKAGVDTRLPSRTWTNLGEMPWPHKAFERFDPRPWSVAVNVELGLVVSSRLAFQVVGEFVVVIPDDGGGGGDDGGGGTPASHHPGHRRQRPLGIIRRWGPIPALRSRSRRRPR